MEHLKLKWVLAEEKVFLDEEPKGESEAGEYSLLRGDRLSLQLAYFWDADYKERGELFAEAPEGVKVRVRKVESVPSRHPVNKLRDEGYLRTAPGLFPDLLRELHEGSELPLPYDVWRSLWIEMEGETAGDYEIKLTIKIKEEQEELKLKVKVIDAVLPKQELIRTEWFHTDCLANYYDVEVFSEEHWRIIENFVKTAADRGCNMLLTPIFTPPIDTKKGGERRTVQLVGVEEADGSYRFDFSKFERWVEMAKRAGMEYFEISHLFSQWGAENAPKIIVKKDGKEEKRFFRHTDAKSSEYREFLHAFLEVFTDKLRELGIEKKTYFHISDEPNLDQLESYKAAKEIVAEKLEGFPIVDALSNYEFYKKGLVEIPVSANDHIEPFLNDRPERLWTYYCTAQAVNVSNRFMALPGYRTRVLGAQLYKYEIDGFLHWGYNFYNSDLSVERIDPYTVTDAAEAFPSGDPFLVYPGKSGMPEESVRLLLMDMAIRDLRAMKLLESLTDRETVLSFIEEEGEITFSMYPKNNNYLTKIREKINRTIEEALK